MGRVGGMVWGKSVIGWKGDESLKEWNGEDKLDECLESVWGSGACERGGVEDGAKCPVAIRLHALQTFRRP